jgi:hypothetical protein
MQLELCCGKRPRQLVEVHKKQLHDDRYRYRYVCSSCSQVSGETHSAEAAVVLWNERVKTKRKERTNERPSEERSEQRSSLKPVVG